MATLNSVTLDVEEMLYGMAQIERPVEDTLATNVTDASDVSWQWTTETLWPRGTYGEYIATSGAAGEVVITAADQAASSDVTVRRSQRNTTAAGGFTAGDVFRVNPTFNRTYIQKIINEIVDNELWPDVYSINERTLTYTAGDTMYDLAALDFKVAKVYQHNLNSDTHFHPFPSGYWDVEDTVHTDVATNSRLLRLYTVFDDTATVYYTAYTQPSSTAFTSLSTEIVNMLPYGTVGKLLLGRTPPMRHDRARRRTDEQIHPDQPRRDYQGFMAEFLRMKANEKRRLRNMSMAQAKWVPALPLRG